MLFDFNTKKLKSQEEMKKESKKNTASSWQHTREEAARSV